MEIIPKWFNYKIEVKHLKGFMIKPFALMMSNFNNILLIDGDNIPLCNVNKLFDNEEYKKYGNIFWKDVLFDNDKINNGIYKSEKDIFNKYNIKSPQEKHFDWSESGQILINKTKCWKALCLSYFLNYHFEIYYKIFLVIKIYII